jgi:hypothetical protein
MYSQTSRYFLGYVFLDSRPQSLADLMSLYELVSLCLPTSASGI